MKEGFLNSGYSKIPISEKLSGRVDSAVRHGIRKEKRKRFTRVACIAAAVLILFISTINISPAFAGYMGSIPGFSGFVKLVKFDKGIKTAIDNDFIQVVERSAEDKGIKLTIKNIVFDKRRLILFYTIESREGYDELRTQYNVRLVDKDNKQIDICHQVGLYPNDKSIASIKKDGFFGFMNLIGFDLPEELTLTCREMYYKNSNGNEKETKITGNWDISFKLDKKFLDAKPEEITMNKMGEIGPIKYNIEKVEIYPTAVYVTIGYDETKGFEFIDFKNLRLLDESGIEYKGLRQIIDDTHKKRTFMFESTYFINSKELTLAADGIYHIPKEEQYVIFDVKNKKLIDNGGYGIEYPCARKETGNLDKRYNLRVDFNIIDKEIVENRKIQGALVEGIGFDHALDEKGNKYEIKSSTNNLYNDNIIERTLCLDTGKNLPKILKFKVGFALKGTSEKINIKIK